MKDARERKSIKRLASLLIFAAGLFLFTACYILNNDIVFDGGAPNFVPLYPYAPAQGQTQPFNGVFDGNGKTIKNLHIFNDTSGYTGLVGRIGDNAVVKDLTLENVLFCGSYVGGIAGYSAGTIENCHVSGTLRNADAGEGIDAIGFLMYGGIVADMWGKSLAGCSSDVTIQIADAVASVRIGGIAANILFLQQTDLSLSADVTVAVNTAGDVTAGGLFGSAYAGTVVSGEVQCDITVTRAADAAVGGAAGAASGDFTASGFTAGGEISVSAAERVQLGGLLGSGAGHALFTAENAVFAGSLSAVVYGDGTIPRCYAGGIAGYTDDFSAERVSFAGSLSAVITGSGQAACHAGGIAGHADMLEAEKSYASGTITVAVKTSFLSYVGGFVGQVSANASEGLLSLTDCYTDMAIAVRGTAFIGGIAGQTVDLSLSHVYTVSSVACDTDGAAMAVIPSATGSAEAVNVHWLSGRGADEEAPAAGSPAGYVRHDDMADFYQLADALNAGRTPVWENASAAAPPSLPPQA